MIGPKNSKYRKTYGPWVNKNSKETKYIFPIFGTYGLKAEEAGIISEWELEAARWTLKKNLKKSTKIWLCIFPDRSISSKPTEVWMGKGKGMHDYWSCIVKKGWILFEIASNGLSEEAVIYACKDAGQKLSVRTVIIKIHE